MRLEDEGSKLTALGTERTLRELKAGGVLIRLSVSMYQILSIFSALLQLDTSLAGV